MRVAGGVVPAGAGGDPAAESGELEALREVAQGQAVRSKSVLHGRSQRAGLDARGQAHLVDLDDAGQAG